MALKRWHCWIRKSISSGEDHYGCLDEKKNLQKVLES